MVLIKQDMNKNPYDGDWSFKVLQAQALQLECILAAKVQYGMWIELPSANP